MIILTDTDVYGRKFRYITEIKPLQGYCKFNPGRLPTLLYDRQEALKDLVSSTKDSVLFGVCRRSLPRNNNTTRYAYYFSLWWSAAMWSDPCMSKTFLKPT